VAKAAAGQELEGTLPPIPEARYHNGAEILRVAPLTFLGVNADFNRELKRIAAEEAKFPSADVLTAQTLATPEALRHARASVVAYQRLQPQREAAMRKFSNDADARMLPLFEGRPEMRAEYDRKRADREKRMADLVKAQRAGIAAVDQVVRLAEAHSGDLVVEDGLLAFPTRSRWPNSTGGSTW